MAAPALSCAGGRHHHRQEVRAHGWRLACRTASPSTRTAWSRGTPPCENETQWHRCVPGPQLAALPWKTPGRGRSSMHGSLQRMRACLRACMQMQSRKLCPWPAVAQAQLCAGPCAIGRPAPGVAATDTRRGRLEEYQRAVSSTAICSSRRCVSPCLWPRQTCQTCLKPLT